MSKRPLIARLLLSLVAIVTLIGAWVADYNETHIFNKNWPPHAKFHGGQTLFFSLCAGLLTLFYTWRKKGQGVENIRAAALVGSLYWVTQGLAILMPGSAMVDPEFAATSPHPFGLGGPQPILDVVLLGIVAGAWYMARLAREE